MSVRWHKFGPGYVPLPRIRKDFGNKPREMCWESITYEEIGKNCELYGLLSNLIHLIL